MKPVSVVLSCEHAVNTVPDPYLYLFTKEMPVLQTHRAIDFGASDIVAYLAQALGIEYTSATVTRLLIDCNRSLKNRGCFSSFVEPLSHTEKQSLIEQYYVPYRTAVQNAIQAKINANYQVLHLSIHSFTPILNGVTRNAEIGLLYDPMRHGEKEVARVFRGILIKQTDWRIRMNYPYEGKSDGFTSALRKLYHEQDYLGFEIECNQALIKTHLNIIQQQLAASIQELLIVI